MRHWVMLLAILISGCDAHDSLPPLTLRTPVRSSGGLPGVYGFTDVTLYDSDNWECRESDYKDPFSDAGLRIFRAHLIVAKPIPGDPSRPFECNWHPPAESVQRSTNGN